MEPAPAERGATSTSASRIARAMGPLGNLTRSRAAPKEFDGPPCPRNDLPEDAGRASDPPMSRRFDVLVVGGGIAGLSFALRAAKFAQVAVLTKLSPEVSSTQFAQGGIAAVLDPADSFEAHVEDTLEAGAGLCHREVVELCVREAPERVRELLQLGISFTRNPEGELDLTREGGHSARRVVHADDVTGREVARGLWAACQKEIGRASCRERVEGGVGGGGRRK